MLSRHEQGMKWFKAVANLVLIYGAVSAWFSFGRPNPGAALATALVTMVASLISLGGAAYVLGYLLNKRRPGGSVAAASADQSLPPTPTKPSPELTTSGAEAVSTTEQAPVERRNASPIGATQPTALSPLDAQPSNFLSLRDKFIQGATLSEAETIELVRQTSKLGGDPNLRARDGRTLLHAVVDLGYLDLIALLMSAGADPMLKDGQGWTAMRRAMEGVQAAKSSAILGLLQRSVATR